MVMTEVTTGILMEGLKTLNAYQLEVESHKDEIKELNKSVKETKKELADRLDIPLKALDKALKDFEFAVRTPDLEEVSATLFHALMAHQTLQD